MENGGWLSRKRKRRVDNDNDNGNGSKKNGIIGRGSSTTTAESDSAPVATSSSNNNHAPTSSSASTSSSSSKGIPASLMPHLGWTKLSSACHRPRARKRRNAANDWDRDEGVRKVAGRAVFFIHDPRPDDDDEDESKIWFQGRFFPNAGPTTERDNPPFPSPVSSSQNSWGLLAVQNAIIDECLTCSEGGYRELDLTFIRSKKTSSFVSKKRKKEKKVRWVAQDVVWTGGNMMMLSSDPSSDPYYYNSPTATTNSSSNSKVVEPGVKFEPEKLMEGERAMEVARKYFPSMLKRLHIHNVTNNDVESDNDGANNNAMISKSEAMVLIGNMEVVAPASFVRMGRMAGGAASYSNRYGDDEDSEDDGLWND